jgi:hypothetical protein
MTVEDKVIFYLHQTPLTGLRRWLFGVSGRGQKHLAGVTCLGEDTWLSVASSENKCQMRGIPQRLLRDPPQDREDRKRLCWPLTR